MCAFITEVVLQVSGFNISLATFFLFMILMVWRIAENILNKQLYTAKKLMDLQHEGWTGEHMSLSLL
jgi:hypothetical protein